jgi:hypothetical protein
MHHFECIGIPFVDQPTTGALLSKLAASGTSERRADGGRMIVWHDPSGATMVLNLDANGLIVCAKPSFDAVSRIKVATHSFTPDADCRFCDRLLGDVLPEDSSPLPSLYVELDDLGTSRNQVPLGRSVWVAVTAFAERLKVWRDQSEYDASQRSDKIPFASECLLLIGGTFKPPQACVDMMATVVTVETRRNTATGTNFVYAFVRTSGADLGVVAREIDLPDGLRPGNIVDGRFWLVGRVVGEAA